MRILGFNFTKISASRLEKIGKTTKIHQKFDISDISEEENSLIKDTNLLKVTFKYSVTYEPKNALIELDGIIILTDDKKDLQQMAKDWKKKKNVDKELYLLITKSALDRCILKAMTIEQEFNLPIHQKLINYQLEK